jgi:transcription initiation factor TFIIH subunit 4
MGLFEYIKELPEDIMIQLYGNGQSSLSCAQWTCRAIFQSLSPLCRNLVMRLIFISDFSLADIVGWVHDKDAAILDELVEELLSLHVIVKYEGNKYSVADGFKNGIIESLCGYVEPWSDVLYKVDPNDPIPTIIDLENCCILKWNATLEFLVTSSSTIRITAAMEEFLVSAGLMQRLESSGKGRGGGLCITAKGYEYMLLDMRQQVWTFAVECLKTCSSGLLEVISFLFMLSYCRVGQGYPVSALSPAQLRFMSQFCDLGIIFRPGPRSPLFYPTRIAIAMCAMGEQLQSVPLVNAVAAASGGTIAAEEAGTSISHMRIIVETNFQVVAYVTSDLHLHMLRLFVDSHGMIRMPNVAVGHLTRNSVKAALRMGISAAQIISFLEIHAHPLVANKEPIVPENVTDQLLLWEAENVRVTADEGSYVNLAEIASGDYLDVLYEQIVKYARELDVCLWASVEKKALVVTPEGYGQIRAFAESLDNVG